MSKTKASNEEAAWRRLLEVSSSITDGTSSQEPIKHDPKNIEFLQKVMSASFGGQNGPSVIQKFFNFGLEEPKKLEMDAPALAAAKELAEQLDDFLVLGNFSDAFVTQNGLNAIANLTIHSSNDDLRILYLNLIPSLAENRPEFQQAIADSPIFDEYLKFLESFDKISPAVMSPLISAISSMVRSHPPAFSKFCELNGIDRLEKVIGDVGEDRMAAKAARLLASTHFTMKNEQIEYPKLVALRQSLLKVYETLKIRLGFMYSEGVQKPDVFDFIRDTLEAIINEAIDFADSDISDVKKLDFSKFLNSAENVNKTETDRQIDEAMRKALHI